MPIPLEQFVRQLEESGVLASETLKDFLPPRQSPKDAEDLARELVRHKKLTRFQAEEVYRGKGRSLALGNYILLEKIGAGGMGQVYKAEHQRMHRLVAVKVLPASMTRNAAAVARFEREATAVARLSHPNIVAAFDADLAGDVHFLVMEWVDGIDLAALVKKEGPLPLERALDYVTQAARGLGAAHAQGIVHRDIKPSNLLLDKKGTVKVLDMGLARIDAADIPRQAELTTAGSIMGTVDYMSPEQALNTSSADARSDIYSLGCTLFYLLTGHAAYAGDSLMAKLLAHRDFPIPSLCEARPDLPGTVDRLFRKMVSKQAGDRYQSIAELLPELEGSAVPASALLDQSQSGIFGDSAIARFLSGISDAPAAAPVPSPAPNPAVEARGPAQRSIPRLDRRNVQIGGAVCAALLFLAILISALTDKEGTLVVSVNVTDAEVVVTDAAGQVELSRNAGNGTLIVAIAPGRHQLRVTRSGMVPYLTEFEIKAGGTRTIKARLLQDENAESPPGSGGPAQPDTAALLDDLPGFAPPAGKGGQSETQAANWVLQAGGKTVIEVAGKPQLLSGNSRVPKEPFQIVGVDLAGAAIDDKGLQRLRNLSHLRTLSLEDTPVTGAGLSSVATLPALAELNLLGTRVDDVGLKRLYNMHTLKLVRLTGSRVTATGVAALRKELPKAKVQWFEWNL